MTKNSKRPDTPDVSKRNTLRYSALGLALLGVSSVVIYNEAMTVSPSNTPASQWLRKTDLPFFFAILPVIIKDNAFRDPAALGECIYAIDNYIQTLPAVTQTELRDLLTMVNSPLKGLATGVWGRWENTSKARVEQFLERWRTSSLSLLNKAYSNLVSLAANQWYSMPQSWPSIHYPGPLYTKSLLTTPNNF